MRIKVEQIDNTEVLQKFNNQLFTEEQLMEIREL